MPVSRTNQHVGLLGGGSLVHEGPSGPGERMLGWQLYEGGLCVAQVCGLVCLIREAHDALT